MLISPGYAALNTQLHQKDATYGTRAFRYSNFIIGRCAEQGHKTLLDYGCGKGTLALMLRQQKGHSLKIVNYDPAIPTFSQRPEPADFVVCLDVLEHIEPDCLADVLADLCRLTLKEAFFNIALHKSSKSLADGRNAHLIIETADWWKQQLEKYFTITDSTLIGGLEYRVLLKPKEKEC